MKMLKEKYGSVLAVVLIVLLVMTLIVFAIASMSVKNMNNVVGEYWEDRARFGAISGVHRVLTELSLNSSYNTDLTDIPITGDPDVVYTTDVDNNVGNAVGKWGPDNRTWIPPGGVYVRSVGKMRSLAASSVTAVAAVISPQRPVFDEALFGNQGVSMTDSQTISWFPGMTGEKQGHVGTNAITNNVITLANNSRVDGDAISGVDPTAVAPYPTISVDGTSTVVGDMKTADESKLVLSFPGQIPPAVPLPAQTGDAAGSVLPPGSYGPLELRGTAVTLTSGNYYFQNYIDLRPNGATPAEIRIDPSVTIGSPVRVYFNTSCVFWGDARVNWTPADTPGEPRCLQIYGAEPPATPALPTPTLYLRSVDKLAFVSAGGNLDMFLTDAQVHGALIGRQITCDSSIVFYDTRLKGVPLDGAGAFEILSMVVEPGDRVPDPAPPPNPPAVAVNAPAPAAGPAPPAPPTLVVPPPPPPPVY